jgi:DNA helicase-2/ATP-dependent DNA helicase PcrA
VLDLDGLNREQLQAVLTTSGPLLVLAGAGSGKTRVITYRLAHLIERGVSPKQILCVTFTNKAAFEMRDRARRLVGKTVRGATISTFHALGSQILKSHAAHCGLRKGFTISDGADQLGTMRRILRVLRIDDRKFDAQKILAHISHAKNAGLDAARFREKEGWIKDDDLGRLTGPDAQVDDEYRVAVIEAYERYESQLRAQNVVDFDDLLLLTLRLLSTDEEVLGRLRRRWHYLMIDEYQDTNGAQFELMRLLAGTERNLCVVGDDDQSIYGWRGADVSNILGFGKHFPGATVVKLETNYRSTARILEVANAIIAQNPDRYDKVLKPAGDQGDPVKLVALEDEDAEAEEIARSILALIASGVSVKDVAILYRSNVQSRAIELALRAAHVPYRVVGGLDLFDRREVKDALAYLKVLHNAEDEQSLRRILNYPPRGIGDTTVERIDDWARSRDLHLLDGLAHAHEVPDVSAKAADAIATFMATLATHRKLLGRQKPSNVVKKLFLAVKLEEALFTSSDDATSAGRRVDNVREIVKQIDRYEQRVKNKKKRAETEVPEEDEGEQFELLEELDEIEGASLDGFLRDLALSGFGDDTPKDEREDQLILSTIHAAKGLEWPHVFLVGVEEELLPHRRTVNGDGEIAEERRLAYVAVTRARRHLTVSYAKNRTRFGQIVPRQRSRFLEGLPEEAVERREGDMKQARTEEEKAAIEKTWRAKIRAQLGIES